MNKLFLIMFVYIFLFPFWSYAEDTATKKTVNIYYATDKFSQCAGKKMHYYIIDIDGEEKEFVKLSDSTYAIPEVSDSLYNSLRSDTVITVALKYKGKFYVTQIFNIFAMYDEIEISYMIWPFKFSFRKRKLLVSSTIGCISNGSPTFDCKSYKNQYERYVSYKKFLCQ